MVERILGSIREWARGRTWWARVPVVLACAWLGVRLVADCDAATIFGAIDLGIHEAGHVVFRFGGDMVCAFGGSLLQCLAPLLCAVVLLRIPDWFGASFCGVWLGVNLFEVARYVADARAQALQLVTIGGGDARHDWNFLLGELGMLGADTTLAGILRGVAFLVLWGSIVGGAALCFLIWRTPVVSPAPFDAFSAVTPPVNGAANASDAPSPSAARPAAPRRIIGSTSRR
ncbi:MAG TPA: hypothetical protein VFG37_05315 [Planctomycetota bacterium]|nr:hypothetical protein [Planctomycetota bacterium]